MNSLVHRLGAAIEVAPPLDIHGKIPHLGQNEAFDLSAPTTQYENSDAGDYDVVSINAGYVEPTNGVLVGYDEFPDLLINYLELVEHKYGYPPMLDVDRIICHEMMHGVACVEQCGREPFYGVVFGLTTDGQGQENLCMLPYTAPVDMTTFRLGAAAMYAIPMNPSPDDVAGISSLGYELSGVVDKIQRHNALGLQPYLPEPEWAGDLVSVA